MKTKLLFLGIFIIFFQVIYSQTIPNEYFINGGNNWTISGGPGIVNGGQNGNQDMITITNSSTATVPFTLKSSQFLLFTGKTYKFNIAYGHYKYWLDPIQGFPGSTQESQLSNVVVKDSGGNIVQTLNFVNNGGSTQGYLEQRDPYESNSFIVPNSGNYTVELSGNIGSSFFEVASQSQGVDSFAYVFDYVSVNESTSSHNIYGKATYDIGSNNCALSSTPLTNIQLKTTGANGIYYSSTNATGDYAFAFEENGTVTTEIITQGLTGTPANHPNTFTNGTASTITNQDFCVTPATIGDDVSVLVIPTSEARPGFKSKYRIQYTNTGSTTVSGDVILNFEDTKMHTPTSNPSATSSNSNSLTFGYLNLTPFEIRTIDVEFTNNTPTQTTNPLNGGGVLNFTANITPLTSDVNQADNSFTLVQPVVNSYDPNDATILEGAQITQQQATQDLHFRLRFQNTGTASAISINVKTMLDSDLDWATFVPIAASHSYNTSLNSTTGEVNFSFPNINLADSTSNEPASHGWVFFKAKPKSSFAVGDTIDCGADIFFDYNMPIVTNVAQTQIHVSASNYTLIPDPAFEQALIDLGYDTVLDGQVLTVNINTIISLGLNDPVNHSNFPNVNTKITDLTGIEDFTALETLTAGDNNLTRVDFSKNLNLKTLQLPKNNITNINISKNLNLEFLNLRNNNLTKLDVSMLPNLGGLSIYNNPDLEVLNVKNGNAAPWQLFLAYNTPKLTCVEVDDVNFFNSNFPSHSNTNSHTSYNSDCNYPTTSIPDSVFENYLETHDRDGNVVSLGDVTSMGNGIANDQKVFTYRICNVIQLDVSGKSIGVLSGIEDFRDLEVFGFLGGSTTITNMDLSNNTKLKRIHSGLLSNLSTITLGSLPDLTFLQFGYDKVTNIDISGLPNLDDLRVLSGKVTSLSTINNLKLKSLAISSPIKHLNVSSNAVLETLSVGSDLETLNIANGNNNNLSLSIQNNSNLTCITADAGIPTNGLSNWNVDSQHTFSSTLCANSLTYVPDDNFEDYLEMHDVNGNVVALGDATSMGNGIANDNYVFTNRINTVQGVFIANLSIADLTGIADFTALKTLYCPQNQLTSLDVTNNLLLERLVCNLNNITNLNVSNNLLLNELSCSDNQITNIDVSSNLALVTLSLGNNQITNINVSSNTSLESLSCDGNQISNIDVMSNNNLKTLTFSNNNIVSLDVSNNTALEYLAGMYNQLQSVDLSDNVSLTTLILRNNQLTNLKINNGANSNILSNNFVITSNPNLTCIEVSDVTYATTNWTNIDAGVNFNTDCSSVWTVNVSAATLAALLVITPSIDTSGNGEITLAEAAAYTSPIDLSGQNLTSVEGLQAFTNVTQINLQNNNITDFSPLTDASIPFIQKSTGKTKIVSRTGVFNLEELNISNNTGVQSLDVSKLTKLKKLIVNDNPDLITVNLKNGNNAAITDFDSSNTLKLTCILVDDINASYLANWTKDAANTFVADEADCRARVLSITQESLQQYISLYPNPIKDFVTVKLSNQLELKDIKIINLLGKEIVNTKLEKVNLSNLPSGIYLLKITTDKGIVTKKIIKE